MEWPDTMLMGVDMEAEGIGMKYTVPSAWK